MKKISLVTAITLLVISFIVASTYNSLDIKDLTPEPQHQRVVQKVTQVLTQLHYKNVSVDDSLSSQLFENYIEYLDYNRSYFTKNDINSFKPFKYQFDEYLKNGNLDAVYLMFNVWQKRMDVRLEFVFNRIEKPFNFEIEEFYEPFRDSINWAENNQELDEYWRKRIKNEFLSLKISGKEEDKIKDILKKRYTNIKRRLSQNHSEDVVQIYLNALASVFDPHTNYFSPKSSEDFKIRMSQSLEGIGARLQTENEYTKVVEIITGGPADRSGLIKAEDLIIGVGQEDESELVDVIGWRIDDVVQLIRGPKNTKVHLQILHDENDLIADAETIIITRDEVKLEDSAAKADTLHIKNNSDEITLGVIKIPAFYLDFDAQRKGDVNFNSTTRDVEKIIEEFQKQNIAGIILDLRSNGGGFLSEAIDLTGLFIENGPVVQVRDVQGKIKVEEDTDPKLVYNGPLVVLVNQFSASASEIFAAAIQDYKRGIIVGNQTFGKGTVQNIWDINRFFPKSKNKYGQVKLTMAKFYRVNGGSTQHVGVIPDIELPTRFKHDEIGESSQKNALLWDKISSVNFEPKENLDKAIPRLKTNHQSRVNSYMPLVSYVEEIEELRDKKRPRSYSLNEEVRRAEREKNKKGDDEDKEEVTDKKKKDDILLRESGNILADYIRILNS